MAKLKSKAEALADLERNGGLVIVKPVAQIIDADMLYAQSVDATPGKRLSPDMPYNEIPQG